ncbi:MAG TPA: transcriptional repressor [Acidimicrobiales bacterium]|nr:transcriptional repressor [Acidimicrobiales bacterium]
MPSQRVEEAIEAIRDSGGRITVDRRAVIEVLDRSDDHLTAEQLADAVWADHPDVNLATIYRTLELFERLEIAFHVHIGHGPSRWHLAGDVHHHLVCEVCDKVIEIPDRTFDPLRVRLEADTGFVIDPHHFSLSGRCAECAAAAPEAPGSASGHDH